MYVYCGVLLLTSIGQLFGPPLFRAGNADVERIINNINRNDMCTNRMSVTWSVNENKRVCLLLLYLSRIEFLCIAPPSANQIYFIAFRASCNGNLAECLWSQFTFTTYVCISITTIIAFPVITNYYKTLARSEPATVDIVRRNDLWSCDNLIDRVTINIGEAVCFQRPAHPWSAKGCW